MELEIRIIPTLVSSNFSSVALDRSTTVDTDGNGLCAGENPLAPRETLATRTVNTTATENCMIFVRCLLILSASNLVENLCDQQLLSAGNCCYYYEQAGSVLIENSLEGIKHEGNNYKPTGLKFDSRQNGELPRELQLDDVVMKA